MCANMLARTLLSCLPVGCIVAAAFAGCSVSAGASLGVGGNDAQASDATSSGDASIGEGGVGDDGGGNDGDSGGSFTEGTHAPFPRIIYQDGGIQTAPKVVTVTFAGDPMATQLAALGATAASSSWWDTVRQGYCEGNNGPCLGDGPTGTSVQIATAPASSYTDSAKGGASTLQTWLQGAIADKTLPAPDTNPITNTIYVLYFPTTTTINLDGSMSCQAFDGYHNSMTSGSQQVVYAVVPECAPPPPPFPNIPAITTLQNTTITAAHELMEAATDPSAVSTGYYMSFDDPTTWGWQDVEGGGEVGDVCVDPFGMNQDETTESGFTVQRIWSNANAAKGIDPCNPIPSSEVYFNAATQYPLYVADVGQSVTVEVDAFSTGPTSDWTLSAQDWSAYANNPYLTFSIGGATQSDAGPVIQVNNGSKVMVTVTLTQDPGSSSNGEADGVIVSLQGDPNQPTAAHWWPFVVMSPADAADAGLDAAVGGQARHGRWPRARPPVRRPLWPGLSVLSRRPRY